MQFKLILSLNLFQVKSYIPTIHVSNNPLIPDIM
jgi:hypothetical protein